MKQIKIKGVIVGYIPKANNVYISERDRDKHFMRKFRGYGVSVNVLKYLKKNGIKNIIIRLTSKDYLFNVDDYLNSHLIHRDGEDVQHFLECEDEKETSVNYENYTKPVNYHKPNKELNMFT